MSDGLSLCAGEMEKQSFLVQRKKPLTLPVLRLLSSKAQGCKDFWKQSKPCHVGNHGKRFAEHSHMSTHVPGLQSFSGFLHHFVLAKLATTSIRVKLPRDSQEQLRPPQKAEGWAVSVRRRTTLLQECKELSRERKVNIIIWNLQNNLVGYDLANWSKDIHT